MYGYPPPAPYSAPSAGYGKESGATGALFATLTAARGVVVRQESQWASAILASEGIPYESQNKYHVGVLPEGKAGCDFPGDPKGWAPTEHELVTLDKFMVAAEESHCLARFCSMLMGVGNLRGLKLHFAVNGATGDAILVKRPFECGGFWGCPLTMDVHHGGSDVLLGRVQQDYSPWFTRCCQVCTTCTVYHGIEVASPGGGPTSRKYTLRANLCCCGRVNNCCGGTCCSSTSAVFDILDTSDNVVGHIEKVYGGPGCAACCRSMAKFDNYILTFPVASSPVDRALLLTSVLQLDYHVFERRKSRRR